MQTLNQYLASRKKSEFARQLGISASQLSQYLSDYRRPSVERMAQIEAMTGGAVPMQVWLLSQDEQGNAPYQVGPIQKSKSSSEGAK